jgi:hypothetical protein
MEQSRTSDDAGSPQAVRERAEIGQDILGATVARGEPGEKQPAHDDPRLSASETVDKLGEIVKIFEAEPYESSFARSQKPGNLNPVAPEDRTIARGPQILAAANVAAGAIGAARTALTTQLEADARLVSDPRYERDQKVFELGQTGKLAGIAPTDAEVAARLSAAGQDPDIADKLPKTGEEQVAQDMPRLAEAERRPAGVAATLVTAGEQDLSEKNNGKTAQEQGRTGDEAVARAKANDLSQAAAPTRPATATGSAIPTGKGPGGPDSNVNAITTEGVQAPITGDAAGKGEVKPMTDAQAEARNKEVIK